MVRSHRGGIAMNVRIVTIAVVAFASGSAIAQQAPPPNVQAQAAERQRQQDALPDTPGTGSFAALKEVDPTLA